MLVSMAGLLGPLCAAAPHAPGPRNALAAPTHIRDLPAIMLPPPIPCLRVHPSRVPWFDPVAIPAEPRDPAAPSRRSLWCSRYESRHAASDCLTPPQPRP